LAVVARISYRMLGDERPYGVNRQIHACYNDCNDYGGGGSGEGSGSVGVKVLRARLTRRDVEDLDLISEISPIRQALGRNRKIQLDVHGYPTGSGYPSTAITGWNCNQLSKATNLAVHATFKKSTDCCRLAKPVGSSASRISS
jgi:hypothetical protein